MTETMFMASIYCLLAVALCVLGILLAKVDKLIDEMWWVIEMIKSLMTYMEDDTE